MPLQATSGAASYDGFGGGAAAVPNYIEEVFSTWLYTGNGATQTITNGIDFSGKGGMLWVKQRSGTYNHAIFDTARTSGSFLSSNTTSAQGGIGGGFSLGSSGFNVNGATLIGESTQTYASWTFRKQPKFFDVVTYTGNGTNGRAIPHNLGSTPGCIIVKCTSAAQAWRVYHRSLSTDYNLELNATDAAFSDGSVTSPTSTTFTVNNYGAANTNGGTYVAYLFAHDAGGFGLTGTDNVISCGSFTSDSNGRADVTLGYEPQFVITKITNTTGNWETTDVMRGLVAKTSVDNTGPASVLFPNLTNAETVDADNISVTPTGFYIKGAGISNTYIYIAIRRGPMKVPTSGTSVFLPISATSSSGTLRTVGFTTDLNISRPRSASSDWIVQDRLRSFGNTNTSGQTKTLNTNDTDPESLNTTLPDIYEVWNTTRRDGAFSSGNNTIWYQFGRAPGFFDEVCYTGTGANLTLSHNLTVKPELALFKRRSGVDSWVEFHDMNASTYSYTFFTSGAGATQPYGTGYRLQAAPTATAMYLNDYSSVNTSGATYVAYLFATCPGVSKVGSYTGTGTTQQINCGFTAGARFVLIKRTDSTGDWYVWDTARGIVAGNDPYLLLNNAAADVTTTDYVDTYSAGFEISSTAPAAINASGGTFIFLAIA